MCYRIHNVFLFKNTGFAIIQKKYRLAFVFLRYLQILFQLLLIFQKIKKQHKST